MLSNAVTLVGQGYDREKAIACDYIKELASRIMFSTIQ